VNTIAQECVAEVDLRSLDQKSLGELERNFLEIVLDVSSEGLQVDTEVIDERPGASLPADHRLVAISVDSARHLDIEVQLEGASMDIAIPLASGIPSVGFGIYRGKGEHTLLEHVDLDSLTGGLKRLALAVLMLSVL
jgi:acetylornithine deacetylase/succinyl-diaminopimelate desuccinylase-like protein